MEKTRLITIEYTEYLELQRSKLDIQINIIEDLLKTIKNSNNINSKEDLIQVLRAYKGIYECNYGLYRGKE